MFEDIETHKKLSKWIIGTFTACILIYLGIRHISHVADAVMWLKDLLNPLLIGLILALFLNVPLGVITTNISIVDDNKAIVDDCSKRPQ